MPLKYERLLDFCFRYGFLGHTVKDCLEKALRDGKRSKEEFLFGLWMRAFAPARRNGSGGRNWESHNGNGPNMGNSNLEKSPKGKGMLIDSEIGGSADSREMIGNHRILDNQELNEISCHPTNLSQEKQLGVLDGLTAWMPNKETLGQGNVASPLINLGQSGQEVCKGSVNLILLRDYNGLNWGFEDYAIQIDWASPRRGPSPRDQTAMGERKS
ncbi:hypothetical protein QYF36_005688 [Acer negundo]|nr:hypothetical protein QYF36_005688 [Acer negundo]